MKLHKTSSLILLLLTLSGCTYNIKQQASTTFLGDQMEIPKNYELVTGKSKKYYFGPFQFGKNSLEEAVQQALWGIPAHTLVNTFIDNNLVCFPLCAFPILTIQETVVTGTPVKIKGHELAHSEDDLDEEIGLATYKNLLQSSPSKWKSHWEGMGDKRRTATKEHL